MVMTCPYCTRLLVRVPKRKALCPFCKNAICVRMKQDFFPESNLFKEEDARAIDWLEKLEVTRTAFESHRNYLSVQFGKTAKVSDVVWRIMNDSVTRVADKNKLGLIYWQMSRFLYEEGKDHLKVAREARKLLLAHWQEAANQGLIKWDRIQLQVITCGPASCEECRKLDKALFTFKQVLEVMPLPVRDCSHDPVKPGLPGWCRCTYGLVPID